MRKLVALGFIWFMCSVIIMSSDAFAHLIPLTSSLFGAPIFANRVRQTSRISASDGIDPETLMEMDVVLFSLKTKPGEMRLGAIQEDGTLSPLSSWTTECAFGNFIEFLVAEEDRWLDEMNTENVIIHSLLDENVISYGSRQVGGGKGPGNPHGEESELLYYVDQELLRKESVGIAVKPELEILW